MQGLFRATNYYNKIESWRDWEKLLQTAGLVNVHEINKISPKPEWGWRRIDKSISKLRTLIQKAAQS